MVELWRIGRFLFVTTILFYFLTLFAVVNRFWNGGMLNGCFPVFQYSIIPLFQTYHYSLLFFNALCCCKSLLEWWNVERLLSSIPILHYSKLTTMKVPNTPNLPRHKLLHHSNSSSCKSSLPERIFPTSVFQFNL